MTPEEVTKLEFERQITQYESIARQERATELESEKRAADAENMAQMFRESSAALNE